VERWWHSGRFLELIVKTGDEALTIDKLTLFETRYPLAMESSFQCDDDSLTGIMNTCFRTLQMCAHETYMDCPYYEQLMYVGDTRLQVLVTFATTYDTRLPKKALKTFEHSMSNHTGLIKCAYPEFMGKIIPSFCLWWVGMVYDYALWRGEKEFIRALMPSARKIVDRYLVNQDENGLLCNPEGWNFYDWANDGENKYYEDDGNWSYGMPASKSGSVNSIFCDGVSLGSNGITIVLPSPA
jgi:alpha-L-rhamnosidase